jgi:hypothetical protein
MCTVYACYAVCTRRLKKTKQHDKHKHSSVHVMQQNDCQHSTMQSNCAVSVMSAQGGCQIHSAVVCAVCALIGESQSIAVLYTNVECLLYKHIATAAACTYICSCCCSSALLLCMLRLAVRFNATVRKRRCVVRSYEFCSHPHFTMLCANKCVALYCSTI